MKYLSLMAASLAVWGLSGAAQATTVVNQAITEAEVRNAQAAWCKALVDISTTGATQGQAAAKALAEKVIDAAYGYQMGAVLFKPTLTVAPQTFRTTRGALWPTLWGETATFRRTLVLRSRGGQSVSPKTPPSSLPETRPAAWATS